MVASECANRSRAGSSSLVRIDLPCYFHHHYTLLVLPVMAFRPLSAAVLPMSVSAGPGSLAGRLVFPALRRASSFPLLAVASSSSASSSSYRLATSRRGYASALPPDTGKPGLTLAEEAKIKSERDAATQRANVAAVQQRMSTRAGRKILDENPVPIHSQS